jgi:hypothetical protein
MVHLPEVINAVKVILGVITDTIVKTEPALGKGLSVFLALFTLLTVLAFSAFITAMLEHVALQAFHELLIFLLGGVAFLLYRQQKKLKTTFLLNE